MIRHSRRGSFLESSNKINSVQQLIDAIEEYSGNRYTKKELEDVKAMCTVHSQDHGGQHILVCLRGDTLTSYYYDLSSVVDECVEKTAQNLLGEDPEDYSAIMEELMTYLEESWTGDLDTYGRISIPCSKSELFSFFDSACEDVDDYIIHLADSYSSDVSDLLKSDEDEEYEEKRTRVETRRPQRRFRIR